MQANQPSHRRWPTVTSAKQALAQAYANYLGYCERVGVKPLSLEQWQAQDKPLIPNFDSPRYGFGDK